MKQMLDKSTVHLPSYRTVSVSVLVLALSLALVLVSCECSCSCLPERCGRRQVHAVVRINTQSWWSKQLEPRVSIVDVRLCLTASRSNYTYFTLSRFHAHLYFFTFCEWCASTIAALTAI